MATNITENVLYFINVIFHIYRIKREKKKFISKANGIKNNFLNAD